MLKTNILGVEVACLDKVELLATVEGWVAGQEKRTLSYINAHCLNISSQDAEYLKILNQLDLVYCDGIGVVWAGRLLHGVKLYKVTGREWIFDLCAYLERVEARIYILAGRRDVAELAGERLREQFPALNIVGTGNGYFPPERNQAVLAAIEVSKPDILFVGMGVPAQEKWIAAHRGALNVPMCWTVGALFDFVAGIEPGVPRWLDRLALEWLWRLMVNPREKWRRYLVGNPVFLCRILGAKFRAMLE